MGKVKVGEANTHHGPRLVEQVGPGLAALGGSIEFGYDADGAYDLLLVHLPDDTNPDMLVALLPGINFSEVYGVDVAAVPDQGVTEVVPQTGDVLVTETVNDGGSTHRPRRGGAK